MCAVPRACVVCAEEAAAAAASADGSYVSAA